MTSEGYQLVVTQQVEAISSHGSLWWMIHVLYLNAAFRLPISAMDCAVPQGVRNLHGASCWATI